MITVSPLFLATINSHSAISLILSFLISSISVCRDSSSILEIILIIKQVSKKNHKFLAETVAEDIAIKCLDLNTAKAVHVTLKKLDIIEGSTEVGVEIKLKK